MPHFFVQIGGSSMDVLGIPRVAAKAEAIIINVYNDGVLVRHGSLGMARQQ